MVYGAFAALAQKDFKRLVAYSSVSHMGYVVLGLGVWSAVGGQRVSTATTGSMGVNGAMFQMIAHGFSLGRHVLPGRRALRPGAPSRPGRVRRALRRMPVYSGLAMGIFFAGLGLPGLCGFIGEVLVMLSVWNYSMVAGRDRGLHGDPDRRLHPLDDPAGLPGGRIQGPARRGT